MWGEPCGKHIWQLFHSIKTNISKIFSLHNTKNPCHLFQLERQGIEYHKLFQKWETTSCHIYAL